MVALRSLVILLGILIGATASFAQSPYYRLPAGEITDKDLEGVDLDRIIVRSRGVNSYYSAAQPPVSAEDAAGLGLEPQPKSDGMGGYIYSVGPQFYSMTSDKEKLRRLIEIINELHRFPGVEDAVLSIATNPETIPNDPYYPIMWNYHRYGPPIEGRSAPGGISLSEAWKRGTGSPEVTVAVLEQGIFEITQISWVAKISAMAMTLYQIPDLPTTWTPRTMTRMTLAISESEIHANGMQPDRPAATWHGSHVAEIVGIGRSNNAMGIAGVNHRIRLLPIRIAGKCNSDPDDTQRAMRWAVGLPVKSVAGQDIPPNKYPARVINLSFGRPLKSYELRCNDRVQQTIREVSQRAIIVVSAGNETIDASRALYASCEGVLVVAAGGRDGRIASFSNYGEKVNLLAPGVGIRSYKMPTPDDPDGILPDSGTSMAAPHVTGVIALMLAQNPKLTNAQIIDILDRTGRYRTPEQCPQKCGKLLDANAAVTEAAKSKPSAQDPTPTPKPHPVKCKCCRAPCGGFDDDPGDDDDDYEPDVVIIKKFYPVPCRPCGYDDDHGYRGYHGHGYHHYHEEDD